MKKKQLITMSIVFITLTNIQAQNLQLQRQTERFVFTMSERYNSREFLEDYDGTPYNSDSFLLGNVYIKNELSKSDVAMRYNVYSDEIEIKKSLQDDDNEITALVKSPDIYVIILNDTFVYVPKGKGLEKGGYFQVLTKGTFYNLYKKLGKKYYEAKKAKTSFERDVPAKFEDRAYYYIHFSNGGVVEIPDGSKKKMYKAFGESENDVKNYCKEKGLDITKENDLKRVITYLDTQKL
jgi:hypothetical protein